MTNLSNGIKMEYTIVSESEANLKQGKISIKTTQQKGGRRSRNRNSTW